jgi:hypothetical protein
MTGINIGKELFPGSDFRLRSGCRTWFFILEIDAPNVVF